MLDAAMSLVNVENVSFWHWQMMMLLVLWLSDTHCARDESSQLVQLVLYIQGNSQTVFLLLMRQDTLSELDIVKDLVWTLPLLAARIVYFCW